MLCTLSVVNIAIQTQSSLQQALYDPSLEYYTAHSKRVRRKRNRHSQATTYPNPGVLGSTTIARPLRPEGWTVRYEYKMACFAEFRGEDEVALKSVPKLLSLCMVLITNHTRHYQDAHNTLVVMFGSTAILPPRTKRWAEAKVLADCINIKVDIFPGLHYNADRSNRLLNCIYTTTNTRSHSHITTPTCDYSAISPADGA